MSLNARTVGVIAGLLIVAGLTGAGSPPSQARQSLEILLTNDDGFDAPGVQAMRRALTAAGHRVTVVAPAERQSGTSGRVTLPSARTPLTIESRDAAGWAVGGSPADAVLVAFQHILADRWPDLVVSGANLGQNVGLDTNSSGTIGAAIRAASFVPAIAVSVEIRLGEADMTPVRFPSTVSAFDPAAAFVVRLIDTLQQNAAVDGRLLPERTVLNVNHPARPAREIRGVRFASVGSTSTYPLAYRETDDPGRLEVVLDAQTAPSEPAGDSDAALLAEGYITLSLLDVARAASTPNQEAVADRLRSLREAAR